MKNKLNIPFNVSLTLYCLFILNI